MDVYIPRWSAAVTYQVYWTPSVGVSTKEWAEAAIDGVTYAPTDKILDDVPPGAPTVVSDGPLLPALDTNITPCLFTTCKIN